MGRGKWIRICLKCGQDDKGIFKNQHHISGDHDEKLLDTDEARKYLANGYRPRRHATFKCNIENECGGIVMEKWVEPTSKEIILEELKKIGNIHILSQFGTDCACGSENGLCVEQLAEKLSKALILI